MKQATTRLGFGLGLGLAFACTAAGCAISDDADDLDPGELDTTASEIINGTTAPDATAPWTVKVAGDEECQGVLFTRRFVLTAAHCVDGMTTGVPVSWTRQDPATGAVASGSSSSGRYVLAHDLALLVLATPFTHPLVIPADLPVRTPSTGDGVVVASTAPVVGQVQVAASTVQLVGEHELELTSSAQLCQRDAGAGVIKTVGGVPYIVGVVTDPTNGTGACGAPGAGFGAVDVLYQLERVTYWTKFWPPTYSGGFANEVELYSFAYDFGMPSPYETVHGDFTGDGRTDYVRLSGTGHYLYKAHYDATTGVRSFIPSAQGFAMPDLGTPSAWITRTGDFNGDGRDDYIRLGGPNAYVFWGATSGTFSMTPQSYTNQSPPLDFGVPTTWETAVGDFNGDGRDDYARVGASGAWLFYGQSNKTFLRKFHDYTPLGLYFDQPSPWQLAVGDFNGDGRTDYARVGANQAFLFYGHTSTVTKFTNGWVLFPSNWDHGWAGAYDLIVGDFNGDGRSDFRRLDADEIYTFLATASSFDFLYEGTWGLDFGSPVKWPTVLGDFNQDGRDDYIRVGDTGAHIMYGSATGFVAHSFWDFERHYGLPSGFTVIAGDFDGMTGDDVAFLGGQYASVYY